jgi:hypothetical protein
MLDYGTELPFYNLLGSAWIEEGAFDEMIVS